MYESLKNLILHMAYANAEEARARVSKAYPKWITEVQKEELLEIICEVYREDV